MKKGFLILFLLFTTTVFYAQDKTPKKVIDTVKTEVVNVITKYNPKIANAKKIVKKPEIKVAPIIIKILTNNMC